MKQSRTGNFKIFVKKLKNIVKHLIRFMILLALVFSTSTIVVNVLTFLVFYPLLATVDKILLTFAVYGLPVSGNQFEEMFMVVNTTGPEVFTGGSFGPEAGAAGLLGLMILLTLNEIYCTLINK